MKALHIRVLNRKRTWLLLLITLLMNGLFFYNNRSDSVFLSYVPLLSVWNQNMIYLESSSGAGLLYSVLFYFLAAMPLSDALVEDQETAFRNQLLLRRSKKDYIRTVFLGNFFYGGLFTVFPLLVHLALAFLVFPILPVNVINVNFYNKFLLGKLILISPLLFYVFRLVLVFLLGGGVASFALFLNTSQNNKYVGLFGVFVLEWLVQLLILLFNRITHQALRIHGIGELAVVLSITEGKATFLYTLVFFGLPLVYFWHLAKEEHPHA